MERPGNRPDLADWSSPGAPRGSDQDEPVLRQAWLEEQVAVYQGLCEEPIRPSPVEFAARVALPDGIGALNFDLRAKLIRRLRVLDGLHYALGQGERGGEDFQTGDVFQDIEILEPIARGGMGRVFRARQKSLGRVVALKTPHWAASLDPREKARFWREAQAIARLRHPGIVPLFAVGQRSGTPFLVLELVEGRPLSEVIQLLKRGALPATGASLGREGASFEIAAAGLVIEILAALHAAHEAGIVHRDVKPGNVMIESSGRVRVLDFGLAKMQLDESLTNSREFLGTLQFTAPEILENPRGANAVSDVYSVGVLLYELLSRELPFGSLSLRALMQRVLTDEPQTLHARCGVSRPLSAIVSKAIARVPTARYQSAREFAADLETFVRGGAVSARSSPVLSRVLQYARGHAAALVAGVAALAVLGLTARLLTRGDEVHARLDPADVRTTLEEALLWDYAEPRRGEASSAPDDGSGEARERLAQAVLADELVLFPRARVHLAVVAAERGDEQVARRYVAELQGAGWQYETMEWIRARLAAAGEPSEGPGAEVVHAGAGRTPETSANDVDRYYLLRGRALRQEDGRDFPTGLERHPSYAAPVLFLAALRRMEGVERDLDGAIEGLRTVQALVPRHPVVEAALLRLAREHVNQRAWSAEEAAAYLAPFVDAAARTAADKPDYPAFWSAYGNLLVLLGRVREARRAFERGLESVPGDPGLLGGMAQTYIDEYSAKRLEGAERQELLARAIALLVEAAGSAPGVQENLVRIADVQRLPLDPEQARALTELRQRAATVPILESLR